MAASKARGCLGLEPREPCTDSSGWLLRFRGAVPGCLGVWHEPRRLIKPELILTSKLPKGASEEELCSFEERGQTYQYGYLRPKPPHRQPLRSTVGSRELDPDSWWIFRPMHYYAPTKSPKGCALAVYDAIAKMGRQAPRGDGHSVLKPQHTEKKGFELDQSGRPVLTGNQRITLLDFIEESLYEGDPVMIGVDHKDGAAGNDDRSTDHWLIITNREYDEKGVFFYGMDNAAKDDTKNAEVKLYISPDLQIWKPRERRRDESFKKPRERRRDEWFKKRSYLVTNARRVRS
jgi:hypothetical protein